MFATAKAILTALSYKTTGFVFACSSTSFHILEVTLLYLGSILCGLICSSSTLKYCFCFDCVIILICRQFCVLNLVDMIAVPDALNEDG